MPDTGAPWNIPYVESTDLVSDWPADSLALANAIDAGLDAAGGLVDVKSALFTGTQTASLASQANVAVTDLSITHEVADPANKLIISAYIGAAGNAAGEGNTGLGVYDGTAFIGSGASAGNRTPVAAGGWIGTASASRAVNSLAVTFVHTPGAGSKTYTVRAININTITRVVTINRESPDTDNQNTPRASSGLVIMEVKV